VNLQTGVRQEVGGDTAQRRGGSIFGIANP